MKKEYELRGEEYMGDGCYGDFSITTGTKKHCNDFMSNIRNDYQYRGMYVTELTEDDFGDEEVA